MTLTLKKGWGCNAFLCNLVRKCSFRNKELQCPPAGCQTVRFIVSGCVLTVTGSVATMTVLSAPQYISFDWFRDCSALTANAVNHGINEFISSGFGYGC